jgi:hypothetical protein
MVEQEFAEHAAGVTPPRDPISVIDASIFDMMETHEIVKEDVKQNRVEYRFPDGLNQIDLIEECRALTKLDDFDTMYDVTMQMLEGKPLVILIKNMDGSRTELCNFQVIDRYMDLRGVEAINSYPYLVNWLTEFIGAYISKKYPTPGRTAPQAQASTNTKKRPKKKTGAATATS